MTEGQHKIVFLSTYPPRECGIATFTQDLLLLSQKRLGTRVNCIVAALNLSPLDTYKYPPEVEWEIDQNDRKAYVSLARTINADANITGVIIQHEYGIFGGEEGEKILSFMKECGKPMLVTLHTVLPNPQPKMKEVTAHIIQFATTIVVLTRNSKKIIEETYPDSIGKVFIIPHGIHDSKFSNPEKFKKILELEHHTILSTFGLLSRNKGIGFVIKALPEVIKKYPSVLYLILGETHPVIRRAEGEKYRIELASLIKKLGLKKYVKFYDQYLSLADLIEFLKATDIYIATSTNPNQAVSGTFSYALGTGRAVISTEFAQAKEIITPEVGRLVPIKNSPALTAALLDLLSDKQRLRTMNHTAYKITRPMLWSNVAEQYVDLLTRTVIPDINLKHLHTLTDEFGLFQFAREAIPNKDFGYTLDDNARALIVCSLLLHKKKSKEVEDLILIYLTFIKKCQLPNGSFINYIGHNKVETEQNTLENLEDAQSRAMWALSVVFANKKIKSDLRDEAKRMFLLTFKNGEKPQSLRARAFIIKSYAIAQEFLPKQKKELLKHIQEHADILVSSLQQNSHKSWRWFEHHLTYNNAILPESLLIAGSITKNESYTDSGIQSLRFLIKKTFSSNLYRPIGHSRWYKNLNERSLYDQQPEDPSSMILALVTAYKNTHNEEYKNLARKCFSWFLGHNTLHKSLYDVDSGGCYDGLHADRVNLNQGAESLISYLMANITIKELK